MSPNRFIACLHVTISASGCVQCWTPDFMSISVSTVHIEEPGKVVAVTVRPSGMICFTKDAGKLIVCRLVKNRKNMKFLPVIKGIPGIVQNK